jgi:rubredoxin
MKVNRRKGLRERTILLIDDRRTTMNPSKNTRKMRKCIICGYIYEEKYGIPFGSVWVCGDCLGTIPMEDLPKILSRREMVNNNG